MSRPKQITISPVLNGYYVQVGCQVVVFESREKLMEELVEYLSDPSGVEREYLKNAVNPMEAEAPPPPITRNPFLPYPPQAVNRPDYPPLEPGMGQIRP